MFSACIIRLKFWLPMRPPICSDGGRPVKARKPGNRRIWPRRRCAICCAVIWRDRPRHELDRQARVVGATRRRRPTRRDERVDVRILDDDVADLLRPLRHVVVRRALRRAQVDEDGIVVLVGNEPGRDDVVHVHRRRQRSPTNTPSIASRWRSTRARLHSVAGEQHVEGAVHQAGEAAFRVDDAQEAAAQHRRQRHRHDAGDQDGGRDRHRELAEEPPEDPAHEENRDEHRGERRGHRQDGEADFLRARQAPPPAGPRPPPCGGRCSRASRWHRPRRSRSRG